MHNEGLILQANYARDRAEATQREVIAFNMLEDKIGNPGAVYELLSRVHARLGNDALVIDKLLARLAQLEELNEK